MTFTEKQIDDAYRSTPQQIQDFIVEGELVKQVVLIGKKNQLHIDVLGNVVQTTRNLLIGLLKPDQFVAELKSMGVAENIIAEITKTLNEKVFGPMRKAQEEALKKPVQQTQAPAPKPASVPAGKPVASVPQAQKPATVQPTTSRQAASLPTQKQGSAPQTLRPNEPIQLEVPPVPKPVQAPTQIRPAPPVHTPTQNTPPARPVVHTMMRDAQHAGDTPTKLVPPQPVTPPPMTPQVPKPTTPAASPLHVAQVATQQPTHSVTPPMQTPTFTEKVPPSNSAGMQKSNPPVPTPRPSAESVKKYGTDPYREPIE